MKCPCEECILIPVCRNRHLIISTAKCSILDAFIEENSTRHKADGIRLIEVAALNQINKIFKWGSYADSM